MIKKILLALAVALPMCVSAQSGKFGVVNAQDILAAMPEVAQAEKTLAEASKQYEDEYAKIQEEFQKLFAEYQKLAQDESTAQSIKDRRLQELQDRDAKAQQFAQTAQQDLQKKQAELMQPIQEKMLKAIKTVGTNNNFTMIFPAEVPAYIGGDVIDVTSMVKSQLGIK